ncbi:pyridoxamine 5'-phosphate oxidase family protein [Streptomyces canus]|uniref:pyridoxamine 5'-phosphate oxidase family protein n=1 Tax=Streptomyces canus TaxID=58343 RepID=UPI0033DDAFAE
MCQGERSMPLSEDIRGALLAEPIVAVLAVEAGTGRGPIATPIWYVHEPVSDDLLMTTEASSRKVKLLRATPRATLLVQQTEPTLRYASAEGIVEFSATTRAVLRRIAARYLPAERLDEYVQRSAVDTFVTLRLKPRSWSGSDLGPVSKLRPVER